MFLIVLLHALIHIFDLKLLILLLIACFIYLFIWFYFCVCYQTINRD